MVQEPGGPDSHEHHDNCLCEIQLETKEVTSDADLPVASGGVAAAGEHTVADDADGCDLDFSTVEPTAEEDLPAATGGVG